MQCPAGVEGGAGLGGGACLAGLGTAAALGPGADPAGPGPAWLGGIAWKRQVKKVSI